MATAGNTVHKLQKFAYSTANNTMVHNTDVVVQGNLTVRGTQTYAQTQTLIVQDNIITLNAAINQSGVPIFDAGIEIDRGSEQNVALLWKESEGAWKFTNDGVNYETLGGGSAGSYANSAFAQANAAFASANNVAPQVQPAFDKANAAYNFANTTTAWGTRQTFVATAGQTVFNVGSGYLVGYIDVYYNGIKLYGGEDYTASDGLSVTLANPALVNDIIEVVGFGANVPVANIYVLNSTTSFLNRQTFFATANQTTFTTAQSYRVGYVDVYYNGLKMVIPDDVVANNGTTIEFIGLTPTTNDVIEIVGLTPNVALANAIPITGGSVSGNLLPAATNTYYLGSATNRWHSLFLGSASLDIDGLVLSNSGGTLAVTSAAGAPSTFIDTFARGQANAAFNSANNVAPQIQPAFDRANAAFAAANNVAPQVQPAFDTANAAFAAANNVAPQIAPAFTQANAAFAAANNVGPQIAPAFIQANAAFAAANSAAVYGSNTATTSSFSIPRGTTAQRPSNPQTGSIRYNTTLNAIEVYHPTAGWQSFSSDSLSVTVYLWGGGGGGGYNSGTGGGGGAAVGTFTLSPGTSYPVVVGGGGESRGPGWGQGPTVPGGGGNTGNGGYAGQGGGYTGIFQNSVSQGNAILMAGGGGGGSWEGPNGGAGGGTTGTAGGNGSSPGGGGGTQSAGGSSVSGSGSALQGGTVGGHSDGGGGGGGGGGYFGGGGGGNDSTGSGGGGGSGYFSAALVTGATLYSGSGATAGNSTDPLRNPASAGNGGSGSGAGQPGLLIIRYVAASARASGGTISVSAPYVYHTFTSSGTFIPS